MSEGKISASDELRLLCEENYEIRASLQEELEKSQGVFMIRRERLERINLHLTAMEILSRKLHGVSVIALSQLDAIKNALPDHKA